MARWGFLFLVALMVARQAAAARVVPAGDKGLTDQKNFPPFGGTGSYGIPFGGFGGGPGTGGVVGGPPFGGIGGIVGTGPNGGITGAGGGLPGGVGTIGGLPGGGAGGLPHP